MKNPGEILQTFRFFPFRESRNSAVSKIRVKAFRQNELKFPFKKGEYNAARVKVIATWLEVLLSPGIDIIRALPDSKRSNSRERLRVGVVAVTADLRQVTRLEAAEAEAKNQLRRDLDQVAREPTEKSEAAANRSGTAPKETTPTSFMIFGIGL